MNKTTLEDRVEIKCRWERGKGAQLGREFGVSRQYTWQIHNNPRIQVPPTNTHKPFRTRFMAWLKSLVGV